MIDVTCFPTFVGATDIISMVMSIHQFYFKNKKTLDTMKYWLLCRHLNAEHTLNDKNTAQARVQMQIVSQLEFQVRLVI